jgi:sialate O-acetylesterase
VKNTCRKRRLITIVMIAVFVLQDLGLASVTNKVNAATQQTVECSVLKEGNYDTSTGAFNAETWFRASEYYKGRTYVQFDLSQISGTVDAATFTARRIYHNGIGGSVGLCVTEEQPWEDQVSSTEEGTLVGDYHNLGSTKDNGTLTVDLTQYVQECIDAGQQTLTVKLMGDPDSTIDNLFVSRYYAEDTSLQSKWGYEASEVPTLSVTYTSDSTNDGETGSTEDNDIVNTKWFVPAYEDLTIPAYEADETSGSIICGEENLNSIRNGATATYYDVDLSQVKGVSVKYSHGGDTGGLVGGSMTLQAVKDGQLLATLGTISLDGTGGNSNWVTTEAELTGAYSGECDLRILFNTYGSTVWAGNYEEITLIKEDVVRSLYYSNEEMEREPVSLTTKLEAGTYTLEYNMTNIAPETINPTVSISHCSSDGTVKNTSQQPYTVASGESKVLSSEITISSENLAMGDYLTLDLLDDGETPVRMIYQAKTVEPKEPMRIEMEEIEWGITSQSNNTSSFVSDTVNGILDNTNKYDIYYLGEKDVTDFNKVAVSAAMKGSNSVLKLYADMDVQQQESWALFEHSSNSKYVSDNKYAKDALSYVTGGTEIASVTVNSTSDTSWGVQGVHEAELLTTLTGTHKLYMVVSSEGSSMYGGNLDYIEFYQYEEVPDAYAFTLANAFADHMVLQAEQPVTIWGDGAANVELKVVLQEETTDTTTEKTVTIGNDNTWSVEFPAFTKGGQYTLSVIRTMDEKTIQVSDVTFGDVFLLAGQSNMERGMSEMADTVEYLNSDSGAEEANNSNIRFLNLYGIEKSGAGVPQEELIDNTWKAMTNTNLSYFSAIGYFVSQNIQRTQDTPVGIISTAVGGTPIKYWQQGGVLYNNRIYPFRKLKVKAILFYQGCSDAFFTGGVPTTEGETVNQYAVAMADLIDTYRTLWKDETLPFYYAGLTRYGVLDHSIIRDGQRKAVQLVQNKKNVGFLSMLDLPGAAEDDGNSNNMTSLNARKSIHPGGKQQVAERFLAAMKKDLYNDKTQLTSGPVYQSMTAKGNQLVLSFETTGALQVMKKEQYADYETDNYISTSGKLDSELQEFEVAGEDGVFYDAQAVIDGDTIIVSSDEVQNPIAVRYAYGAYPEMPNLTDDSSLPTSTFSDELITDTEETDVVCIGNSITAGFGLGSDATNYYPGRLQTILGDQYVVNNKGKSGHYITPGTNQYVTTTEWQEALSLAADKYVIKLGTNDAQPEQWNRYQDRFERDYANVVRSIRAVRPDAEIYLCTPVPILDNLSSNYSHSNEIVNEIISCIKNVAENYQCTLIDINAVFSQYTQEQLQSTYYQSDGLHPNGTGAQLIAETVADAITKVQIGNGDVNGDSKVTAIDALLTLAYAMGTLELNEQCIQAADVVEEYGVVNAQDVLHILIQASKKATA